MKTNGVEIRKMVPSDMPQILKLLQTRPELNEDEALQRMKLMEWIAFNNPKAGDEITYYVADEADKIIAYHGRMPSGFNFKGNEIKGYFMHDLYVDPECRTRGMGLWLTIAFGREIGLQSKHLMVSVWMTAFNLEIQRRRKYLELDSKITTYLKLIEPTSYLQRVVKSKAIARVLGAISSVGLVLLDRVLLGANRPHSDIKVINRFDERFDAFFNKIAPKIGICSWKESKVLNWRYIDRPFPRDTILGLEKNNEVYGYVVLATNPKNADQGFILDIMADPDDRATVDLLIKQAVHFFKKQHIKSISCFVSNAKFGARLQNAFFLKRKEKKVVLLGNLDSNEHELAYHLENWHITKAESDGFMLNT